MSAPHAMLLAEMAREAAKIAALRAERQLRRMRGGLSGDDSGLRTVWDEFCVQVQGEQSFHWDDYELTVKQCVASALTRTPDALQRAIWLQSDDGRSWLDDHADAREIPPLGEDAVADYVYEIVYERADAERSARIERYLESPYELD